MNLTRIMKTNRADAFDLLPGDHPIQSFVPGTNVTSHGCLDYPDLVFISATVFLVLLMYYGCDVSGCLKRAFPRIFSKRDVAVPAPSCHDLNNQQNELRELLPAMFRALPPALVTDHVAVDLEQGNIHYNPRTSNDANDTDDDNWQQRNIRIVPPQNQQQTRANRSSFKRSCHRFCKIIVCCMECMPPLCVSTNTVPAPLLTVVTNRGAEETYRKIPAGFQ